MVKYVKLDKKNLQKAKWFLLSLILCIAVFGIYFAYQTQEINNKADKPTEDKPTEVTKFATQDPALIAEESLEEAINQENVIDIPTTEKSITRKSTDLASRGTPI